MNPACARSRGALQVSESHAHFSGWSHSSKAHFKDDIAMSKFESAGSVGGCVGVEDEGRKAHGPNNDVWVSHSDQGCGKRAKLSDPKSPVQTSHSTVQEGLSASRTKKGGPFGILGAKGHRDGFDNRPQGPTRDSSVLGPRLASGKLNEDSQSRHKGDIRPLSSYTSERVQRVRSWAVEQVPVGGDPWSLCPTVVHVSERGQGRSGSPVSRCLPGEDGVRTQELRRHVVGAFGSKGSSTTFSRQGFLHGGDTGIVRSQIGHDDRDLHRSHASTTACWPGSSEFGSVGSVLDITTRTLRMWSDLSLGDGPLLQGLGRSIPTEPTFWMNHSVMERSGIISDPHLRNLQASTIASSSGSPSSTCSIGGKRVKAPADRSTGRLAEISSNIVNTSVIESWDTENEFKEVSVFMKDIKKFQSLFISELPDSHMRRSKMSTDNQDILMSGDTVEESDTYYCCMSVFQVPKKVDDRFIGDATPINRSQKKPPSANIPKAHVALEGLLRRTYLFSIDAINYFYQFLIEDIEIRKFFCMAFNQRRGRPFLRRMRRIPMGWKYSPCIGQRASNVIARETIRRCGRDVTIFVWIDNFLFGTDSYEDAVHLRTVFLEVCAECNLAVHPSTEISTSLSALGFELDTVTKTLRHSEKFQQSFHQLHSSLSTQSSLKDLVRFLGHCVWTMFARCEPLATVPSIIETLRAVHHLIATRHVSWEAANRLDLGSLLRETKRIMEQRNTPFHLPTASEGMWLEVYSDAMVDADKATWAFVSGDHVSQGTFDFLTHIFIHELLAASSALTAAAKIQPSGQTILFVDNTPVVFALRAGHCSNAWGDDIIKRLFEQLPATFRFKVAHVAGLFNPSDEYTRGTIGRQGAWCYTPWG